MSAHTAGSWTVKENELGHPTIKAMRGSVSWTIATCDFAGGLCEANARLIAAAPELLDAAKRCYMLFTALGHYDDPQLEALRAAIAKAEGQP